MVESKKVEEVPKYVDVSGSGKAAVVLNYVSALGWFAYSVVTAILAYGFFNNDGGLILGMVDAQYLIDLGSSVMMILAFIVFLVWYAKAYKNLKFFGAKPKVSVGWAVVDFFIPIINLFEPYKRMKEISKGSGEKDGGYILLWWLMFLFGGTVFYVGLEMMERVDDEYFAYALLVTAIGSLGEVVVAILTARLVENLTERQVEKAKR